MTADAYLLAIGLKSQTGHPGRVVLAFSSWENHFKWLFYQAFFAQDNLMNQKRYFKSVVQWVICGGGLRRFRSAFWSSAFGVAWRHILQ